MKFGPELVYLTDRLINCPGIFLSEPFTITKKKGLSTITIYSDLKFFICEEYCDSKEITGLTLKESNENINYLTIIQITCYLLFDLFFQNKKEFKENLKLLIFDYLKSYSNVINAKKFIFDAERREELVRFVLYNFDLIPKGESEKFALGRLSTLDSVERGKLISETRKAQIKREKEILAAIRKREAEEAASRMSGE